MDEVRMKYDLMPRFNAPNVRKDDAAKEGKCIRRDVDKGVEGSNKERGEIYGAYTQENFALCIK